MSRVLTLVVPILVELLHAGPSAAQKGPADLIVTRARVYTVDSLRPVVDALAVRDGRVVYAGTRAGALALRGPATRVLDLRGRTVIPGITDAHAHVVRLGQALNTVDLVGTTSYAEVVARVAERATTLPAGAWVLGRGWDQNDWADKRFPTHEALSRAVPDRPVYLTRVDAHAGLANAAAMRAAGIGPATPDTAGGRIERDPAGAPSGVFVDNAQTLVERAIPAISGEQLRDLVADAVAEANRWGLTGVHDAGADRQTIEAYESLARADSLPLRLYVMVADDSAALDYYLRRGPQSALFDGHLWVRSIKLYADGAVGSRGAALLEPYVDDKRNRGLLVTPPEHIRAVAARALRGGFQLCVHAIGDRGNRIVLDAYESALGEVPVRDHRFRVEHAQLLSPADIPRFRRLGVIPSMQPSHQTSDMYWVERRVGAARLRGAYAWRSLLRTGVVIASGTDFPVEQVNPMITFHSAVTRQDANNQPPGGWRGEERMTREEALRSMTLWPAYAGFQEGELGSLAPGKHADFVVLDQDIMRVPARRILRTRVLATYVGGRAVYTRTRRSPEPRRP